MVNLAEFVGIQSDEPIGPQPPIPGGVREMEVSLDTQSDPPKMRLVLPGGRTWYFKSLYGKAECIGSDNETGRLYFRGMAQLIGDSKMVLRRAPDAEIHPVIEGGYMLPNTLNRICYRRAGQDWRYRDELLTREKGWNHPDALRHGTNVVGDFAAEYREEDRAFHIMHRGWSMMEPDGTIHLYDPDIRG